MNHSYAEQVNVTCPGCGNTFSTEVWVLVDAAERPDLIERIRADSLHDVDCPHCGHRGAMNAPLLLYRPNETPLLIFSPAQGTTTEQDQKQALGLVNLLRQRLAADWQDEWLAEGLATVPRSQLTAASFAEKTGGVDSDIPPELGTILGELDQPARLNDMPRRIQLCQQALALVRRKGNAYLWAWLQVELGRVHIFR